MPEFLRSAFAPDVHLDWTDVLWRQILAFVFGLLVALVYRFSHGKQARDNRSLMSTLVLLTLLIAMISSVIGDNVARAFSLVGALSIVRFRTVVEDTRDTAFVILAVGVGMALGAGYLVVPIIVLPMAALAAWMFDPKHLNGGSKSIEVRVRMTLGADVTHIQRVLESKASQVKAFGASTVRQGAEIEMAYSLKLNDPDGIRILLDELNSIEAVTAVNIDSK